MALINTQLREAKPREKDYKLADGHGMYLLVKSNGAKYWRIDYRFRGKRKTLSLGVYPEVTLKAARERLREMRELLAKNQDPSEIRKEQRSKQDDISFEQEALLWWENQSRSWGDKHAGNVWRRLRDNTFSDLGHLAINEITTPKVIAVLRKIETRGSLDVANRVKQAISGVCGYAVQRGTATHNPAGQLAKIIQQPNPVHRPSLPRAELPKFLRALETYHKRGRRLTQLAIKLLMLTFVRSGELRGAKWGEFDYKEKLWRIPAERMKMKVEHLVPLSSQALAILEEIKRMTGTYELVFPSERLRSKPMSDNTMRRAIFKLGYDGLTEGKSKAVPHGFRATAASILNETGFNPDAIERQLAHKETNSVRAAYTHHARYLDERIRMMQWWADFLDQQEQGTNVIPLAIA